MFGRRKQEKIVECRLYKQIVIPKNEKGIAKLVKELNGRIVLLQSEHDGELYYRGRLSYNNQDSRVLYLLTLFKREEISRRIHLHDITGLMEEF